MQRFPGDRYARQGTVKDTITSLLMILFENERVCDTLERSADLEQVATFVNDLRASNEMKKAIATGGASLEEKPDEADRNAKRRSVSHLLEFSIISHWLSVGYLFNHCLNSSI